MILTGFPWYATAACIVVGVAYAVLLYFVGPKQFGRGIRWILAAFRMVVVSIVAFLLLAPTSRREVHERQKPHVVLAQDVSYSMRQSSDSVYTLEELKSRLEERFRVSYLPFGSDEATDIGAVLDRYRGDDVSAMVMATDGIHNHGVMPTSVAGQLTFPVYSVALGDTSRRCDARLHDLRCNRIAMLGNSFPLEIGVGADLLKGHSARLSIEDASGKELFTKRIEYTGNQYDELVNTTLEAKQPGLHRYTVRLGAVEGELSLDNNRMTFYVDVIDTRRKVVIFANAPHPDVAALRSAIESNPSYEVRVAMADDVEKGKTRLSNDDVEVAIFHNLPSKSHPLTAIGFEVPVLYVVGLQTDLSRFNSMHSGLEIDARSRKTNEVTACHQAAFPLFAVTDDDAKAIESMPPLSAPFGQARLSQGVQPLFTARLGKLDTRQPLIAAGNLAGQRRVFVWGEGLWRWRLYDYQERESHEVFDRLVSQLVGFAALQGTRDRLQVNAERSYGREVQVEIDATLYDETYKLTNVPEVSLKLSKADDRGKYSDAGEYPFRREGKGYKLILPPLAEGLYRYAAHGDGQQTEGYFAVESLNLEQRQLSADHSLLATLAATTGGKVYHPGDEDELLEELAAIKPVIYTHWRYLEFIRLPWVLVLILLLLVAEWTIRKYCGEV